MSTIATSVICNNNNNVGCRCQQTVDSDADFDARFGAGSNIAKNYVEHQHRKNGTKHVIIIGVEQDNDDNESKSCENIVHDDDIVYQNEINTSCIHQICPLINVLLLVNLLYLIFFMFI